MQQYIVRNLPSLVTQSTGTGAVTNALGNLDDANCITIFLCSSAGSGIPLIQVSQYDPAIASPQPGVSESTTWRVLQAFAATSSGTAIMITNVGFRGLRLANTSSAATGEIIAYASKQILV